MYGRVCGLRPGHLSPFLRYTSICISYSIILAARTKRVQRYEFALNVANSSVEMGKVLIYLVGGVDDRNDGFQFDAHAQIEIGLNFLQHQRRIGQPGCLHDQAIQPDIH